jgi:hypothetical protein
MFTLYPASRNALAVVGVRAERCLRCLHSDLRCIVVDMDKVGSVSQLQLLVLEGAASSRSAVDIIAKLARIRVRRQTFQCVRDTQLSYLIFDELN